MRGLKLKKETEWEQDKRRIPFGMRNLRTPNGKEKEDRLSALPLVSNILVYRKAKRSCTGPFRIENVDDETVVVQIKCPEDGGFFAQLVSDHGAPQH